MTTPPRFASVIGAGLLWLCAASADAAMVQLVTTCNGAQETPPNGSAASCSAGFTMDTTANTLYMAITIVVPPPSGETMAHIHGFAPAGVPAGILFSLPLGSPKIATWNYTEPQEASIINALTYVNIHSNAFPGGEIRGQIYRIPSCGDGILDGGETCDDGNIVSGDCCSSLCQVEPSGSACPSDGNACTLDECDGAGNCGVGAPRTGCRTAQKGLLGIKNSGDDSKDKLLWKWLKGQETTQADFGLPTGTTAYTLCLYAGTTSAPLGSADILPGINWSAVADKGYKLSDPSGTPDGIQKALLKGGAEDKAKILVKGKGDNLPDVLTGILPLPVTAQLVNDANPICFGSQFDSSDVKKNDGTQFKAKAQ